MIFDKTQLKVFLRPPAVKDAYEFVEKTRASIEFHRPWVFPATTEQGYLDYLKRIQNDRNEGFVVCRQEDGDIVGLINVSEITRGALQSAYVGYWGVDGHQGNGYMSEGLALVFDQAFGSIGLHRLEINIQPGNSRSIAMVERLGLTKEGFSEKYLNIGGEWKDHERWAVLSDSWKARGGAEGVLGEMRGK